MYNHPKKVNKFIFPGATLIVSFYLSALFGLGLVIGYLGTNIFCKRFIETERIDLIIFNLGTWEIHLHHWILGGLGVLASYSVGLLSLLWIGGLVGLIFHDLHTDKKWHKVVYKKNI